MNMPALGRNMEDCLRLVRTQADDSLDLGVLEREKHPANRGPIQGSYLEIRTELEEEIDAI